MMNIPLGNPAFSSPYPRALAALQQAVDELLASGWDELHRRRAQELTLALLQSSKLEGRWETEGILRALDSLLALSLAGAPGLRPAVIGKVLELLGLLQQGSRTTRTA
jgi:hypothetical protein